MSHGVRCGLTMFTKQVSRPLDGLDPPSRPTRRKRVERTRRETWSRALSEVLVPFTILRTHWSRCRSMVSVPFSHYSDSSRVWCRELDPSGLDEPFRECVGRGESDRRVSHLCALGAEHLFERARVLESRSRIREGANVSRPSRSKHVSDSVNSRFSQPHDCSPFRPPLDEGVISGRPQPFLCVLAPRSTGEHREGLQLPRRRSACERDAPAPGDPCFRERPRRLSPTGHRRLRT